MTQQATAKQTKTAISPCRHEDFPEWYQEVVKAADMAENSDVRGCMVIKPWGYGIWELIQQYLDRRFKETGHKNAYFPLFIPLSYLQKEAEHVEGFATECAVVTHHRLEKDADGKLVPGGKLTEPLVVRPTSETIIGASFSKWVQSYRDLPILINQWANVVRWEMRTRMFLRTAEFLWQEGHTVHETAEEAMKEAHQMLGVYNNLAKDFLALHCITGRKSENEKFAGAVETYTYEIMVQDGKALQAGTSHFLGQNFAKGSEIKFLSRENKEEYAWTTSWGTTTRLIGILIMSHSDDDGLVLPPRVAPSQIVIIPVIPKDDQRERVLEACHQLANKLQAKTAWGEAVRVEVDARDVANGEKNWGWIKKGVPLRVQIGPRDIDANSVFVTRRHLGSSDKWTVSTDEFVNNIETTLKEAHEALYKRSVELHESKTKLIDSKEEFYAFFTPKNADKPEIHGGFALAHWNGSIEIAEKIKEDLKVTIRCIPFEDKGGGAGKCIFTGEPSKQRVVWAKSY